MSVENVKKLIEQTKTVNNKLNTKVNEWLKIKPNLNKIINQDIKEMNYAFNQNK
jgi:hypothetical protein